MSWISKAWKKVTKPFKKVIGSVATILGGGSSSSSPSVQEVKTEPPVVSVTDISGDTNKNDSSANEAKKKRRKGFMSTQKNTILGTSDSDTLG